MGLGHTATTLDAFARLIDRAAWIVIAVTILLTVLAVMPLPLGYDDDVIRFLPERDPEVIRLKAIADRFGSIHVALVGIDTDNLFTPDRLAFARRLHKALEAKLPDQVSSVTSLTEITAAEPGTDPTTGEPMTLQRALVPTPLPTDPAAYPKLRAGVLRLDYIAGSLVSDDGGAARLILKLREHDAHGKRLSTKETAEQIRQVAESLDRPEGVQLHFGGAPFIAEEAANGSQRDIKRLAPWVALIIVSLIFVSLGSVAAALLALGSVGIGILWTMGIMGAVGAPLTLVSTALPVILIALGSAYAVHLLVWYLDHDDGVPGMLQQVGWPVTVAALTTMAGFGSFLVMDLAPMREFGWQMALGAGICALVSMTFIPAVLTVAPIETKRRRMRISDWMDQALVNMAGGSRRYRWVVLGFLLAVGLLFGSRLKNIETRMDTSSFFQKGSAPERADAFMSERFGGAVFLQILVEADIHDPAVLRRIAGFEDRVSGVPGVTRIESITSVLAIVNEAVGSGRRELPQTRGAAEYLGKLAYDSDKAVSLLVDATWTGAVVQVAIGGFDTAVVEQVTAQIRTLAHEHLQGHVALVPRPVIPSADLIGDAAERLAALASPNAISIPALTHALSPQRLGGPDRIQETVTKILDAEIGEDEMVMVTQDTDLRRLARAVTQDVRSGQLSLESFRRRLTVVADPEELKDLTSFNKGVRYVFDIVQDDTRRLTITPLVARTLATLGPMSARLKHRARAIVSELMSPTQPAERAGGAAITATVSGYPVVQQAMTRSVYRNQIWSLLTSLPLVLLILIVVFRSVLAGLVGFLPTGLTLLITFGLMGMFPRRLPLDIGSSMLASIALGVGIDYAIHFLWRYRALGLEGAMRNTGRAIVINAAEITAGFVVLAFASIVPMSNFGLLVAETLCVAAGATLILMPALVEWWQPTRGD